MPRIPARRRRRTPKPAPMPTPGAPRPLPPGVNPGRPVAPGGGGIIGGRNAGKRRIPPGSPKPAPMPTPKPPVASGRNRGGNTKIPKGPYNTPPQFNRPGGPGTNMPTPPGGGSSSGGRPASGVVSSVNKNPSFDIPKGPYNTNMPSLSGSPTNGVSSNQSSGPSGTVRGSRPRR